MTAATIADCILLPWKGDPSRPALVIDDVHVSHEQLREESLAYARGLRDLGIAVGDTVGIMMPNSVGWVEALLATALLGAITVPLNTRHEIDELRYVAGHADLSAIVTTSWGAGKTDLLAVAHHSFPEVWGDAPPDGYDSLSLRHVIVAGREDPGTALPVGLRPRDAAGEATTADPVVGVDRRDTACILYTSGTTSRPKGCLMSHEALVRTGVARFDERRYGPDPRTVWSPCPLFHVGALVPLLGCLATGSTFVTSRQFCPEDALAMLAREGVTTALPLFSAFTDALLDSPAFASTDLSRLRDVLTTGPVRGVVRAQRAFSPARLVAGYGMTELCGVAAATPVDENDEERLVWSGRPFQAIEMAVADPDTGERLPAGEIGEIVARGYCTVTGYLEDEGATGAAFDEQGWFHTGDMGVASGDGRIAYRGRYKDILKVGGENVSAIEVEEFIGRHPAVRRVEVVGAPDERLNEVVAAFVELEPGATATEEELVSFCRGRIARFKVPRLVRFVSPGTWPMSTTKVDKVQLRQRVTVEQVTRQ